MAIQVILWSILIGIIFYLCGSLKASNIIIDNLHNQINDLKDENFKLNREVIQCKTKLLDKK